MSTFEARVTAKGQITLPSKLRAMLGAEPGDVVSFSEDGDGGLRVESRPQTLGDLKGIIKSGPSFTSADFARWLKEARERGMPEQGRKGETS